MISFSDKLTLPQAELDLHNYGPITPYEVESIVDEFLQTSQVEGMTKVIIITGKGINSKNGPVLRPMVMKLLKKSKLVRNFEYASSNRGGDGALEVYLQDL